MRTIVKTGSRDVQGWKMVDFRKSGFEPACKEHWPMDLSRGQYDHFCVDKDFLEVHKTGDRNGNF